MDFAFHMLPVVNIWPIVLAWLSRGISGLALADEAFREVDKGTPLIYSVTTKSGQ